ncbi:MAG: molybdenum cofactor guanylyltransferase [Thermodesulfobacteriota bacterium]
MMAHPCTGVILAGGLSSRFSGQNKAFFELAGRRIIEPIIEVFAEIFDDILIVTNTPLQYLEWDVDLVSDIFPVRSSLTGIHAGLFYSRNPYIFVAACDTPFIQKEMVELVLSEIEPGVAAVMPETPSGTEPLFAVYARQSLDRVGRHIRAGKLKIQRVFSRQRVKKIPPARLRQIDPELRSFFNINTEKDFHSACRAITE